MRWLAVMLLLAPAGALGASGKVGKAIKALDKFHAGDRGALETARAAADQAAAHPKSAADPEAWAVRGRIYLLHLTSALPPRPDMDPAALAIESFERAVELGASGAVHGQLSQWVPILESTVVTALLNDVEGKRWEVAEERLDMALRVRALGEQLGSRDDQKVAQSRRLGVQITARSGRIDEARAHYEAFVGAAERHDPGLAALVARELAAAGDLDGALAFLKPLAAELPDDERLLRTEIEILVAGERRDEAARRVDQATELLRSSVSGAFLAASLYDVVGAEERARELWEHTLSLDARHFEAHLLLGRSLLNEAAEIAATLEASEAIETAEPDDEIGAMAAQLADLWIRVFRHLETAHEVDSQRREPLEILISAIEARHGDVEPAALTGRDKEAHAAEVQKLEGLRNTLSALGG